MEHFKVANVLLSDEDIRVLLETLWHTCQRWDIPSEDRARARSLRERLGEQLDAA